MLFPRLTTGVGHGGAPLLRRGAQVAVRSLASRALRAIIAQAPLRDPSARVDRFHTVARAFADTTTPQYHSMVVETHISEGTLSVLAVPLHTDNYCYVIRVGDQDAIVVDPSDVEPVAHVLEQLGARLAAVLVTHHHEDHCAGIDELKVRMGASDADVFASDERVRAATRRVVDGDVVGVTRASDGSALSLAVVDRDSAQARDALVAFDVLHTPPHTREHVSYVMRHGAERHPHAVFCGDFLFAGGMGRFFEGTAAEAARSLRAFRQLPPETLVFCGHEYTEQNLAFAKIFGDVFTESGEADSSVLDERIAAVGKRRQQLLPTVPSTVGEEMRTNIFLQVFESRALAAKLRCLDADPVEMLRLVREAKDRW